jgi:hypothetical protein
MRRRSSAVSAATPECRDIGPPEKLGHVGRIDRRRLDPDDDLVRPRRRDLSLLEAQTELTVGVISDRSSREAMLMLACLPLARG